MSKRIAGKTFMTLAEAGKNPPTAEQIARARKAFDEFQKEVDAVKPEDVPKEISPKFWDDTSGTEFDPRRE